MAVDWEIHMRRPMIYALAEAAAEFGSAVVAVNRPLCPISTALTKRHRLGELFKPAGIDKITDNLYLFSPTYVIYDGIANTVRPLERFNLVALRRSYARLERRLGITEKSPLIWFNHPQQGYVMKLFEDSFCVFELYDNLADNDGLTTDSLARLEQRMRGRTDLLLTTSQKIHETYSSYYKHAIMFGNGLSRSNYLRLIDENITKIDVITDIPSPRIGYAGMISERLNWPLITEMAERKPDWSFIFAGHLSHPDIPERYGRYPNIYFPGEFSHEQVPAVLKSFDVGLLPYLYNPFFYFLNPLKFYEYAAAGLASVSSDIEELKQYPNSLVDIVPDDANKWIQAIKRKLKRDVDDVRRIGIDIAGKYIWEDMTVNLLKQISERML